MSVIDVVIGLIHLQGQRVNLPWADCTFSGVILSGNAVSKWQVHPLLFPSFGYTLSRACYYRRQTYTLRNTCTLLRLSQVLALVHRSSATTDDTYSHKVGLTALTSVVPAWLEAGKALQDLWSCVVNALPGLPAHRRLGLLCALLQVCMI